MESGTLCVSFVKTNALFWHFVHGSLIEDRFLLERFTSRTRARLCPRLALRSPPTQVLSRAPLDMSRTTKGLAPRPSPHQSMTLPPVMRWPPPDYWARGPPRRNQTKFTTYGYEISLVRQRGGSYTQEPRPSAQVPMRPRSDACLVRPERSLSVSQIMAGEYFCRPDPAAYVRLLGRQHEAASSKKKLPPLGASAPGAGPLLDGSKIWDGLMQMEGEEALASSLKSSLKSMTH